MIITSQSQDQNAFVPYLIGGSTGAHFDSIDCSIHRSSSWNFEAAANMAMNKIKEKMTTLKESIDRADEREADAKSELKEAEARAEHQANEAEAIRRRIKLLSAELAKVEERVDEQQERLDHVTQKGEKEEMVRKELEEVETEGDEKITELESLIVEASKEREEKTNVLNEAKRREVVLQRDLQTAVDREEKSMSTVRQLEKSLDRITEKMQNLEQADEEASEREQVTEEKMLFLGEQLKDANSRVDTAEREIGKLERTADSIMEEINSWKGKKKELEEEMQEITAIADEDI